MRDSSRRASGFTVIELMIVVAVVGLLSAVAYPAYVDSVRKSRRSDAVAAITSVQQAQERYRSSNTTYGTRFIVSSSALVGVGVAGDTNAATAYTSPGAYYSLSLSGTSASAYTILATAQGTQTSDTNCQFMQVQMAAGALTYASGSSSSVANGTTANNSCWRR